MPDDLPQIEEQTPDSVVFWKLGDDTIAVDTPGTNLVLSLVPPGGLTGQRLSKRSDESGDTMWSTPSNISNLTEIATRNFSDLQSKPTTISGYGITDFNSLGDARWSSLSHVHSFSSLTSKPTTIAGYGITDLNTLGDSRWASITHSHAFADITAKPTTLAGYGIVDGGGGGGSGIFTDLDFTGSNLTSLATRSYTDLQNLPTLFTQAAANALYSVLAHTHTFASLTSKPTTIGGFGITDLNSLGDARWSLSAHTHAFADLTSKPTTVAGYGITDLNSLGDARWSVLAHTHTFASLTSKPTTLAGYGIVDSFDGVFTSLTSKPTTIGGYGITDLNSLGDARWSLLGHTHSPGGSNTQVQYNNSGALGGVTGATTNGTTLTLASPITTGSILAAEGTAGAPAYAFSGFPTTGLFDNGLGTAMYFSIATAPSLGVTGTRMKIPSGSAFSWVPSTDLTAASDTLLLRNAAGVVGVTSIIDVATGFRIAGAAASGNVLRGNGTNFVSAALTSSDVGLGSVTNDVQTKNSIVPNTAPASGNVLIGNAGGTAYAKNAISGSGATITLGATGVLTISAIAQASITGAPSGAFVGDTDAQTLTTKTLTSPIIGTSVTLNAATIVKHTVPTSTDTATGPVTGDYNSGYSSSAITDLVYLDSSSTWQKADANLSAGYDKLLGIALEVKASAAALLVALPGSFIMHSAWTWTVGGPIYMSETAGALTQTQPVTTDAAIRVVGWAVTATKMYFFPSPDYITHT